MTFEQHYIDTGLASDKGTVHQYIYSFYSDEFTPKKNDELTIVEIGINKGDSLILWRDWFINSKIFGIDSKYDMTSEYIEIVDSITGVNVIYRDAYDNETCNLFENESIDYLIDDGPHTIESQIECVNQWFSKIKKGGKLIIEDIQYFDRNKHKFDELGLEYQIIDTRHTNPHNQYNDVLIIFKKNK
jgi:hypothetical protein